MQGYSPPVERTLMDGQNSRLPEQVSKSAELVHTARHSTLHTAEHSTQLTALCTLHTAQLTVCVRSLTLGGGRVQFYASPSLHPSIFPLMQVVSANHYYVDSIAVSFPLEM